MTNERTRGEKRLLGLMQMGAYLIPADGHIWIEVDDRIDDNLDSILTKLGVQLNNKIYGGIEQALDTIDEALRLAGQPTLETVFNAYLMFDVKLGSDSSRIRKVEPWKGGIV